MSALKHEPFGPSLRSPGPHHAATTMFCPDHELEDGTDASTHNQPHPCLPDPLVCTRLQRYGRLAIGAYYDESTTDDAGTYRQYFDGKLDEFRIFNYDLTPSEIEMI